MKISELLCQNGFSLNINGKRMSLSHSNRKEEMKGKKWKEKYEVENNLAIIREVIYYEEFNAVEWILCLKKKKKKKTGTVTELWDCDVHIPFKPDEPLKEGFRAYDPAFKVIYAFGGINSPEDFTPKEKFLLNGEYMVLGSEGGRSSSPLMPYIELLQGQEGIIASVGWSGEWRAVINRMSDAVLQIGIPNLEFYLNPGEAIRTCRIVLMAYENGSINGHNQFRRFLKKYYSIIGNNGRPEKGPLALSMWGGINSRKLEDRIRKVKKYNLGVEYIWIDAGWYGNSLLPCPDEHSGDWGTHAGSWNINTLYHPDKLIDVARTIKKAGMKFILWCEPERAVQGSTWVKEHPEWFIESSDEGWKGTFLLNLGNTEALKAAVNLVDELITKLDLDCYRQDFNMEPITFWENNDPEERKGITQIKHIMGLYQFWDTLLEKHPRLFIDNCASGGRRLDIELMKRSVPLWESDYTCIWNFDEEDVQSHISGAMWWMVYTGTGTGITIGDVYRFRSCYASSLVSARWSYDFLNMEENDKARKEYDWARKQFDEYKRVREYFSEDYYPITKPSLCKDSWSILQFDRPKQEDGIILAFRRSQSCMSVANPQLYAVLEDKMYELEDFDTGEKTICSGMDLKEGNWELKIQNKRESRILIYKKIKENGYSI